MDETVTHYITSHPADQTVHVDGNALAINVQDDHGGRVAIMHSQTYSTSLCRQVSVGDQVVEGQWSDEMIDPDGRLAALMAHITAQQSRGQPQMHHKVHTVRGDVDTSIILDSSMRLFHGQPMDQSQEPIVVEVPSLPPLPPLQDMKRCQETDWFNKNKQSHKDDSSMIDSDGPVLELGPGASPGQHKLQSRKSLPHKKRISRKLKKNNGNCTPQQEIVVISCRDEEGRISCAEHGTEQEILPDNFVQQDHMPDETHHHITHEVRPIFICQLCGEFYGDEQLKFFHHLKQHYEPHIIIENPVQDLGIDKMTTSCIVDNVQTIPDSIVELSLENSIPKTMYQSMDKHVLYTTSDKTFTYANNKLQYSMASMDKEPTTVVQEAEKADLYDTLDKLDLYSCGKCNKSFRKQKQCEAHIKEAHSNMKLEDMGEFSEPEDLMEGIHVAVEEPAEQFALLPHLTVENGHAHQDNVRHWYGRSASGPPSATCCTSAPHDTHHLKLLKDEVLRRILESDVPSINQNFPGNSLPEPTDTADPTDPPDLPPDEPALDDKSDDKKKSKKFECQQCNRVFQHRNSLLYHMLSHSGKQQMCRECGKGFYTVAALKIHKRVHNGDRPYKCDVCGRDFRQWSDLKYHKVSIHSDQKMFKCEFCGKEFARKYSLNVHRRIHTGEKNYKCEYCNKTFRASSYRLSHMRTHTGDRPHKCLQCDKCFRVAGDLRRHMLTHDKLLVQDKLRNRLADHKATKLKDHKEDKKPTVKQEVKHPNVKIEEIQLSKNIKKIALASTTKQPNILRTVLTTDKKKPKKSVKKGAPNVTIDQIDDSYTNNVEVFDTRQDSYGKLNIVKKMYSPDYKQELDNPFSKQIITAYKDEQTQESEFAILRPMFRGNGLCDTVETDQTVFRTENTDGKMQVYTHIEKNNTIVPNSQVSLNDMRHLEREVRNEIHGETTENGFIERLTALYNIPAV